MWAQNRRTLTLESRTRVPRRRTSAAGYWVDCAASRLAQRDLAARIGEQAGALGAWSVPAGSRSSWSPLVNHWDHSGHFYLAESGHFYLGITFRLRIMYIMLNYGWTIRRVVSHLSCLKDVGTPPISLSLVLLYSSTTWQCGAPRSCR
jgi:hypothetical protein